MAKILIIDDSRVIIHVAQDFLNRNSHEVLSAQDGPQGLHLARSHHPDLILLDFIIPDLDGFEVTKKIRANQRLRKIPIIAVTSITDPEELERVKNCGVNALITKPIESEGFLKKIDRILYATNLG